jgi:hypothetical protein
MLVLGPVNAGHSMRFVERLLAHYRRHAIKVRAVLTDGGPEYIAADFPAHLVAKELAHVRIQGTMLDECWRPALHRRRFTSLRQLPAEADAWLVNYHHRRRNHGDYMRGRTPQEVLDTHKQRKAA